MNTTAPSKLRIGLMIAFTLSCLGLMIFVWTQFGGSVPFEPQGYRVTRCSPRPGCSCRTPTSDLGRQRRQGRERPDTTIGPVDPTVLQVDPKYAPRPRTRARSCARRHSRGGVRGALDRQPLGAEAARRRHDPGIAGRAHAAADQARKLQYERPEERSRPGCRTTAWRSPTVERPSMTRFAQLFPFATQRPQRRPAGSAPRQRARPEPCLPTAARFWSADQPATRTQLQGLIRNADTVFKATAGAGLQTCKQPSSSSRPSWRPRVRRSDTVKQFAGNTKPLIDEVAAGSGATQHGARTDRKVGADAERRCFEGPGSVDPRRGTHSHPGA